MSETKIWKRIYCPKCSRVVATIKEAVKTLYGTVKCPYCGHWMALEVSERVGLKVVSVVDAYKTKS